MIIASIDIGSNTVLMLIAEADKNDGKITPLRDEQRIPRISEGLVTEGYISEKSTVRLMTVLSDYNNIIEEYHCDKVIINGTSALRKAANSNAIRSLIEKELKEDLKIISGEDEAELSFLGTVDYSIPGENRLVIDIGGGSTEIIYGTDKVIKYRQSFDIGVVSLSEKYPEFVKSLESVQSFINMKFKKLTVLLPELLNAPVMTIALAGTPVTLACILKDMTYYDEQIVEGSVLSRENIEYLYSFLFRFTPSELLNKYPVTVKGRQDIILTGTYILLYIMKILKIDKVIVSAKGIRYGAIVKYWYKQH